jgi:hypothetical protein
MKSLTMVIVFFAGLAAAEEDPGYELVRGAAPDLKVRQTAALSLSIVPHAGHRLLPAGPVTIRLKGEGVKLQRALYPREEAVDPRADVPRFELSVTGEKAGPARVEAQCTFYLCRGQLCRPVETATLFTLEVREK